MASVTQCDSCKEVIDRHVKPLRVSVVVVQGDETTVYNDVSDACSKKCFEALIDKAKAGIQRVRL